MAILSGKTNRLGTSILCRLWAKLRGQSPKRLFFCLRHLGRWFLRPSGSQAHCLQLWSGPGHGGDGEPLPGVGGGGGSRVAADVLEPWICYLFFCLGTPETKKNGIEDVGGPCIHGDLLSIPILAHRCSLLTDRRGFWPQVGGSSATDATDATAPRLGASNSFAMAEGGAAEQQEPSAPMPLLHPRPQLGPPARCPFSSLFWLGGFPY